MNVLVDIEASIDYPEYDVEEVTENNVENALQEVHEKLISLQKSFVLHLHAKVILLIDINK